MSEEVKEIRLEVGRVSGRDGEDNDLKVIKFTGRQLASFRSYHGENGYRSYEVYDTLEEVKDPEGLIREAKEALGQDPADGLNI